MHQPPFKGSIATHGWQLPYGTGLMAYNAAVVEISAGAVLCGARPLGVGLGSPGCSLALQWPTGRWVRSWDTASARCVAL